MQEFPIIAKLGGREAVFALLRQTSPGKVQTIDAMRMWLARKSIPGWAQVILLQAADEKDIKYTAHDLLPNDPSGSDPVREAS